MRKILFLAAALVVVVLGGREVATAQENGTVPSYKVLLPVVANERSRVFLYGEVKIELQHELFDSAKFPYGFIVWISRNMSCEYATFRFYRNGEYERSTDAANIYPTSDGQGARLSQGLPHNRFDYREFYTWDAVLDCDELQVTTPRARFRAGESQPRILFPDG